MLGLIFSILFVFLGFGGAILILSGMLNSYQEKRLEYMAYRNQAKAKNILDLESSNIVLTSEEDYYKNHGLAGGVIDINFISREIKANFLKPETYSNFIKNSSTKIVDSASKIDLGLVGNQLKVNYTKAFKYLKEKYQELISFLIKITQPIDDKDLEVSKASTRSAIATSSRIKRLNSAILDISGKSQDFIKARFSKTKLDIWPNQKDEISLDIYERKVEQDQTPQIQTLNSITTTSQHDDDSDVYEQLEDKILEKLHENLTDFELWQSLGDFYIQNNETSKAKEVFSYIQKHSHDDNQLLRIKNKI
jgi:hypothetical protein